MAQDDEGSDSYSSDEVRNIYERFRDFLWDDILSGRISDSVREKIKEKIKELDEQIESMSTDEDEEDE